MARWTGNGLADGTTLDTTNVNAAGNGDTVSRAISGTPTVFATGGDGFDVAGASGTLAQIRFTGISASGVVAQVFFTANGSRNSGNSGIVDITAAGSSRLRVFIDTVGVLRLFANNASTIAASASPALPLGHRFRIDVAAQLDASPTSTNGHYFYRVQNLTDSSWNGSGSFFYENAAGDLGSATLTQIFFGKIASTTQADAYRYEQVGYLVRTIPAGAVGESAALTNYFMPSPYAAPVTANRLFTFTTIAKIGPGTTPTGVFAGIGDSTWYQDGNGEGRIKTILAAKGYPPEKIFFYGNIGKAIFQADSNGKTVAQNIADARAQLGVEPDVWLFNLGGNGAGRTEAETRGDIDSVFDLIGGFRRLLWVGLSQANTNSSAATRLQWNSYAKPRVIERGGEWLDWNAYIKSYPGGDSALWNSDGIHMTNAGYDVKNGFTTAAIGDTLTAIAAAGSSLPAFTQVAAATSTRPAFPAAATSPLPAIVQAAAATSTPPGVTAVAVSALPPVSQSATAAATSPVFAATTSSDLPAMGQTATASSTSPNSVAIAASALPGFTQSSVAAAAPPSSTGTATSMLPAFTQTAQGIVGAVIIGVISNVLPAFFTQISGGSGVPGIPAVRTLTSAGPIRTLTGSAPARTLEGSIP